MIQWLIATAKNFKKKVVSKIISITNFTLYQNFLQNFQPTEKTTGKTTKSMITVVVCEWEFLFQLPFYIFT